MNLHTQQTRLRNPGTGTSRHSRRLCQQATQPRQLYARHAIARSSSSDKSMYKLESVDESDMNGSTTVFIDKRDGELKQVMCYDYGYRSGVGRMYMSKDGTIPSSGITLAVENFKQELESLRVSVRYDEYAGVASRRPADSAIRKAAYSLGKSIVRGFASLDHALERAGVLPKLVLSPEARDDAISAPTSAEQKGERNQIREKLKGLMLSDEAIMERERKREKAGGKVLSPWYSRALYNVVCFLLDVIFSNRPIQRFWFLETVARMPYFSYISCIHLYETLGWWRAAAELRKIHFAEEWNELHHLQIMEALGGDQLWFDRFCGYHAALVYYWVLVATYILSPAVAYNFSELLEAHAVDTYGEFVDANADLLKSLTPPQCAVEYYRGDLYMLDEFQTDASIAGRDPPCDTLYDVFANIRDDEWEHVKTMKACQDASVMSEIVARREKTRRTT